jgi:hypothetical protein
METRSGKSPSHRAFFSGSCIHFILIALVGLMAYSNTFDSPFVFDDDAFLEDHLIRKLDNFTSSLKGYHQATGRFIGYLTFALNYHFGGLEVRGYHIVNLIIHIINAFLVYLLDNQCLSGVSSCGPYLQDTVFRISGCQ